LLKKIAISHNKNHHKTLTISALQTTCNNNKHQKLFISYILVNDSTIETPVSFAVEQLKTISVCKKKQ